MHRRGFAGDWLKNRIVVRDETGMPPAHLLRRVLETAPDFAAAKKILSETPLAVPALFLLSGVRDGEGCIIERTEREAVVRPLENHAVCVANHFETRIGREAAGWRARPIDSTGRAAAARALHGIEDDFAWFAPPIANVNSRLAFQANAAAGTLSLIGTDGVKPVTKVFRLPR